MTAFPSPPTTPLLGHLWHWTRHPTRLLEAGSRVGPVFQLALWRPVVVGYRPDWNRGLLGDLDTFRSQGSLSDLTPYLSAGVVHRDVPSHDDRRRELNPHFHARAVQAWSDTLAKIAERDTPAGPVEALDWSARLVRRMLNTVFFGERVPDSLLSRFLAPLHRNAPAPLLPRPRLFGRINAAIRDVLKDPPPDSLAAQLSTLDDAVDELRVALSAGYDTTAHTLAWAVWHLAGQPQWLSREFLPAVIDETLRLYPAGWLGSRVTHRDVSLAGAELSAGTMVLYSPYLTHRDPAVWPDPTSFRPQRFTTTGRPAWGFLPFGAGRRTCLGAGLARAILTTALAQVCELPLRPLAGDPRVTSGITLRPAGPLWVHRG